MPGEGKRTTAAVLRILRKLRQPSCWRTRKAAWPQLISGLAREVAEGRAREALLRERLAWYQALTARYAEVAGVTLTAPPGERHLHIAGGPR